MAGVRKGRRRVEIDGRTEQCHCQSEFVNVAKIAKLFQSSGECRTIGGQIVIAVSQEMNSGGGKG